MHIIKVVGTRNVNPGRCVVTLYCESFLKKGLLYGKCFILYILKQTGCYECICACTMSICLWDRLGVFTVKVMGTGCVVLTRDVRSDRTRLEWGFYVRK